LTLGRKNNYREFVYILNFFGNFLIKIAEDLNMKLEIVTGIY